MHKTYIATTQEAKALHDGTQTAIISKMRVQPKCDTHRLHTVLDTTADKENIGSHFWAKIDNGYPERESDYFKPPYAIGQEVVVREAWIKLYGPDLVEYEYVYKDHEHACNILGWRSPATMPVSAARTRIIPVSCEAVRVQSILGNSGLLYPLTCGKDGIECGRNLYKHSVHKLGQSAWDNNDYIFYYKIEKI